MTELGVFGITKMPLFGVSVQGHLELNPGSVPRTKNLDAQRRNEEPMLLGGNGGPLTKNGFS